MIIFKRHFKIYAVISLLIFILVLCILYKLPVKNSLSELKPNQLRIHYIDVGQGDAALIQINNKNLLIDSGPDKKAYLYLRKLGIKTLDYVIITHPHEDHIGGLNYIIKNINTKTYYLPNVISSSESFKNVLQSLRSKNFNVSTGKAGIKIDLDKNLSLLMLSPVNNLYTEINHYSIVLKLNFMETSFLFCGDSEIINEEEILSKGYNIDSDIIKIAHHGSNSSTSENFLNEVSPKVAVISVGKDNEYGHPHKETLLKLKNKNIQLFRTDLQGTIVLESDGYKILRRK
ncbi:ribonuclease BN [Clostridium homopropionicum DSM 5847]|uniref:Ribonuclease BN n=1 Tax=Clostridium homopropionicum DSM 5847 TaxID=1121318 RepID=A0A0L6ZE99_9CLOT|nr:ComEC/Rec2 family competence protein [Clostridium homopropionicum]KOA21309.1 ribonuclease BN [Clostridium homopropionicum DSM 5847]SFG30704.1 competence protein ComEC [Clostridium homopropionicum]